jgi:hypothetical protein
MRVSKQNIAERSVLVTGINDGNINHDLPLYSLSNRQRR